MSVIGEDRSCTGDRDDATVTDVMRLREGDTLGPPDGATLQLFAPESTSTGLGPPAICGDSRRLTRLGGVGVTCIWSLWPPRSRDTLASGLRS